MGGNALAEPLQHMGGDVRHDAWSRADSPAIRFLDALRTGDDATLLELCTELTTVTAHNMGWSCRGRDEIALMLEEARVFFPGLTIEPRMRDIGFGLVIEELRVQDALEENDDAAVADGEASSDDEHPMWDGPVSTQRALALWSEDLLTPMRLNMPVRVTVRHDDLQVHEVSLEFPAALLKRSMGLHVDPLEMSLSQVQSLFIAPEGTGLTTRTLGLVAPVTETEEPEVEAPVLTTKPRRRRRRLVLVALGVAAVVGAGSWYALRGSEAAPQSATPTATVSTAAQPSVQPSVQASVAPASASASASQVPTVTHAKPADVPSRTPNVTLKSDLAFGFDSSTLSKQAEKAIDQVAAHVRSAGLTGKIYVDGYTDDLGSAAHGQVLSQQRADAVAHYLGSQLAGTDVSIVSTGHGESHPVADNHTAKGRQANRRVTITLPTA